MSIVLALAASVALQGPAAGRDRDMVQESRDDMRRRSARYGQCVVSRQPVKALAYVQQGAQPHARAATVKEAVERIEESNSAAKKLIIGDCLFRSADSASDVRMTFPGETMRFVLADALFRKDLASRAPLSHLEQVAQINHLAPLNQLGECVVRRDPKGSHNLLSTKVLAPEESVALTALKPAMADCLPAKATVQLNKMLIRGVVAYNYVLLANAPRGPLTASVAK